MTGRGRWRPLAAALVLAGCSVSFGSGRARPVEVPPLSERDAARLAELRRAVAERPEDPKALRALGIFAMWRTLEGHRELQVEAEEALMAALAADPTDKTVARMLGRFFNMRAVEGDVSRAKAQVWAYETYLGAAADDPLALTTRGFTAWCFAQMGRALVHAREGRLVRALRVVRRLERTLEARVEADPTNVELHALAGNFAFFFAGNLPAGKRRRIARAVRHFTYVRQHWDRMRAGAKDPRHCPNTYENFMFELAEGHLALGRLERARPIYEELTRVRPPETPVKLQIAAAARARLQHLDALAGDLALMPPWPSDGDNCVVCHAPRASVGFRTFHGPLPDLLPDAGTGRQALRPHSPAPSPSSGS